MCEDGYVFGFGHILDTFDELVCDLAKIKKLVIGKYGSVLESGIFDEFLYHTENVFESSRRLT